VKRRLVDRDALSAKSLHDHANGEEHMQDPTGAKENPDGPEYVRLHTLSRWQHSWMLDKPP